MRISYDDLCGFIRGTLVEHLMIEQFLVEPIEELPAEAQRQSKPTVTKATKKLKSKDRILVSFGFGANNIYTEEFEKGTILRQNEQNQNNNLMKINKFNK